MSIALAEIQERRDRKRVPGGLLLHEYANLYVNARNPMLSRRRDMNTSICVVQVDCSILDQEEVVISDQNAASKYARFAAAPAGLAIVSRELTFAESWLHPEDQILEWRHKSAMCAEVLVPDHVPSNFLCGAYVCNHAVGTQVEALGPGIPITVNSRLFF